MLSLVYITNRPGGYDILFHSLNQQILTDDSLQYELIAIDECLERQGTVIGLAGKLAINLVHLGPSKVRGSQRRFGYCNALNTGLMKVRGDTVILIQDYCWLPADLLQTVSNFYKSRRDKKCLLSFPEIFYQTPKELLRIDDPSDLSIFSEEMVRSPKDLNWKILKSQQPDPSIYKITTSSLQESDPIFVRENYWECYLGAAPTDLFLELNGFDERLDDGDDCHERNIWQRATEYLDYQIFLCISLPAIQFDHHRWSDDILWGRKTENNNKERWGAIKKETTDSGRFRSPNDFDLRSLNAVKSDDIEIPTSSILSSDTYKIAFCWDWPNEITQLVSWQDGLAAAINLLQKRSDIDLRIFTQIERQSVICNTIPHQFFPIEGYDTAVNMQEDIIKWDPDFVLFWADMTRPSIPRLSQRFPSGICFAGGQTVTEMTDLFKIIFVESQTYYQSLKSKGYNVHRAFGTNTDLFCPTPSVKIWTGCFPATFIHWKRHELYLAAIKKYRELHDQDHSLFLACGWKCDERISQKCRESDVFTCHHLPASSLPDIYNASYATVITSKTTGGSQRTTLESMACNIPVITTHDSEKNAEYLIQAGYPDLVVDADPEAISEKLWEIQIDSNFSFDTRDFVLKNYSHHTYERSLYQGIISILRK